MEKQKNQDRDKKNDEQSKKKKFDMDKEDGGKKSYEGDLPADQNYDDPLDDLFEHIPPL